MADMQNDALLLDNQLCFPLYAASREVVKRYRPHLDEINLTYTQYITMLVMWERGQCSVKELGKRLYLDSGTLTPVLKSLEQKGYLRRFRSPQDERVLLAELTVAGQELKAEAADVPQKVGCALNLSPDKAAELYMLLHELLNSMQETGEKLEQK